jgi:hypothetical protein
MICSLLAPLALAACLTPLPTQPVAVTTGLHGWRQLAGKRLRVDRVLEDSRCPMNARCVWAGRATVRLTLRDGTRTRRADLSLGETIPFADGQLALTSVTPEKMAGAQPKLPAPYRFTLEYRP